MNPENNRFPPLSKDPRIKDAQIMCREAQSDPLVVDLGRDLILVLKKVRDALVWIIKS